MINMPYAETSPELYDWFLYSSGIYWGELFKHVFIDKWRGDFIEFLVHHLATVFLVFGSSFSNHTPIGTIISFIHLVSDIPVGIVKCMGSTHFDNVTVGIFVGLHMPTWFYWRLVCLPLWIIPIFTDPVCRYNPYGHIVFEYDIFNQIFGIYLAVLQILQFYWFWLFIKMVLSALKTGEAEDHQEKVVERANTDQVKEKKD